MNSTCLRDIKVWFSHKKGTSSKRVSGLDEFGHEYDSEEDDSRDDRDTTMIPTDKSVSQIITILAPLVEEGPSSG